MGNPYVHPFVVSTLVWEPSPQQRSLTVSVKATFVLSHLAKEPQLSHEQDGFHDDVLWDPAPHASLYSPSDVAPFKPRADVLLVGSAFAPGGAPAEMVTARLSLGGLDKALRVTGERAWVPSPEGPRPSPARPFARASLRYERAARRGDNLVGIAPGDPARPPPEIDLADDRAAQSPAATPGFGPIAPAWRAHLHKLPPEAFAWASRLRGAPAEGTDPRTLGGGPRYALRAPESAGPAPPGFDFGFFNAAPRDQQLDPLAPGAMLVLENLSPRVPKLGARLPTMVPRVFHVDAMGRVADVPMRCDTLWIDTDREAFVLWWRGVTKLQPPFEKGLGALWIAAQAHDDKVSLQEIDRLASPRAQAPSEPPPAPRPDRASAPPAPADRASAPPADATVEAQPSPIKASLPFDNQKRRRAPATLALGEMPARAAPVPFPLAPPHAEDSPPKPSIAVVSATPFGPGGAAQLGPSPAAARAKLALGQTVALPDGADSPPSTVPVPAPIPAPAAVPPPMVPVPPPMIPQAAPAPIPQAATPPVQPAPTPPIAIPPVQPAPIPQVATPPVQPAEPPPMAKPPSAPPPAPAPQGSPWRNDPEPAAAPAATAPTRPAPGPAVKSSLYEGFAPKKR